MQTSILKSRACFAVLALTLGMLTCSRTARTQTVTVTDDQLPSPQLGYDHITYVADGKGPVDDIFMWNLWIRFWNPPTIPTNKDTAGSQDDSIFDGEGAVHGDTNYNMSGKLNNYFVGGPNGDVYYCLKFKVAIDDGGGPAGIRYITAYTSINHYSY